MFKINFHLRTNYVKTNGESPIYLILSDNNTQKKKVLSSISVNRKYWNKQHKKVLHNAANALEKNKYLQNLIQKSYDFNLKNSVNDLNLNFDDYCNFMLDIKQQTNINQHSYCDFAIDFYNKNKAVYSEGFYRLCVCEISKLQKFVDDVVIENIDYKFLSSYENYMINTLKNKKNTVVKTFKRMKTVLNEAVRQNIITVNPFSNYKLSYEKTNKMYLDAAELKIIENMYFNSKMNDTLKTVLKYFLFSCYTGLRFADVAALTGQNLKENYIQLTMHKTKDNIIIPLSNKAKKIIDNRDGVIFKTYTNQRTNIYLKVIMLQAGIDKDISFHCSRHTFATMSLTLGISIEVLSKLLGHTDIKTTQIYAKIIDQRKFDEMEKWNDL